jgi:hypothetical protein
MQKFLEISPSGIDPCELWRHWGAGWVSSILVILGFVTGGFNLLPGEASSESMGVANTCGRLGERQSQQSSAKERFVEFKRRQAEFSNLNSWGFTSMGG